MDNRCKAAVVIIERNGKFLSLSVFLLFKVGNLCLFLFSIFQLYKVGRSE